MDVVLSSAVEKQLTKIPMHVKIKLMAWANSVRTRGMSVVRKIPGYHDEPLHGTKQGRRSIRLNKQWRAEYMQRKHGVIEFILVVEVHPHAYKS